MCEGDLISSSNLWHQKESRWEILCNNSEHAQRFLTTLKKLCRIRGRTWAFPLGCSTHSVEMQPSGGPALPEDHLWCPVSTSGYKYVQGEKNLQPVCALFKHHSVITGKLKFGPERVVEAVASYSTSVCYVCHIFRNWKQRVTCCLLKQAKLLLRLQGVICF